VADSDEALDAALAWPCTAAPTLSREPWPGDDTPAAAAAGRPADAIDGWGASSRRPPWPPTSALASDAEDEADAAEAADL